MSLFFKINLNKIKMNNKYTFNNFNYIIKNNLITKDIIALAVAEFFKKELENNGPNKKIAILFKMKTSKGEWRNISTLQIFETIDVETLIEVFNIHWSYRSDHYHQINWSNIVFRYRFIEDEISPEKSVFNYPLDFEKTPALLPDGYKNLPNNRLFETWGDNVTILNTNNIIVNKDSHQFMINKINNDYYVTIYYKKIKIISFQDKYDNNENNINTFIRYIGNFEMNYINGVCNFLTQLVKTDYIKKKNPDTSIKDNFITMDLETRDINNEKQVFTASLFDGKKCKSFYLSDYDSSDSLLKECILYLFQRKYLGYRVYLHNFSNFDGIFMLRIMAEMDECKIERSILRDGRIIDIKLSYNLNNKRKYSIYFRDSLLILPSSLKKLGDSFTPDLKKGIYPYKFVNDLNVGLDYKGNVPRFKFFDKKQVEIKEYLEYRKMFGNNWCLRSETIKYCENDVILLYLIIKEFQKFIFRLFEADINNYPTLSSLAFAIYRMKYLNNFKIPVIVGELYKTIKESYTGGSVDVYKSLGKNVYRYDVNSLYPSVMSDFPSPVGNIKKFKGDILNKIDNPFGFFYVKIKTPENMHIPILQTRIKTSKAGVRTVSPLGEWEGWYFSEEILNAKKYGYKIEVLWGYTFEKEYIFKDYVNDLYKIKKESIKDSSSYTISKLLLNSLYGRFGMSPDKQNHIIIKGDFEIGKFITNTNIKISDSVQLGDQTELISYIKNNELEDDYLSSNISVAISSSITAYARIKMSEIKVKYSDNIYYSDTDSIDLDLELPPKYISNELGDFKFEKKFRNVVYIAPKVYAAITDTGKEYVVVKGFKKDIEYDKIANIINNNKELKLKQEKWYKNISEGKIITNMETYTLMTTENKRKLIYENNKIVKSVPYNYIDGKLF